MSVRVVSDIQPVAVRLVFVYLIQHDRSCCTYVVHIYIYITCFTYSKMLKAYVLKFRTTHGSVARL